MSTEVTIIDPKEYQIEESKAKELLGNLPQIQLERDVLQKQFNEIIKLDIDDKETSKVAKELRLKILKNRTQGLGAWHKTTKDYFLKGGQFVDAIKRKEEAVNVDMEATLEAIEKHAENQEKERIKKLQELRVALISEYVDDTTGLDLGNMQDDVFEAYLGAKKQAKADKIEAERIAEENRVSEEKRLEEERLVLEKAKQLHEQRKTLLIDFWTFVSDEYKNTDYSKLTEEEFSILLENSKEKLLLDIEKKENQRLENERLKAEAEKKAILRNERSKLLQPYVIFIRDYNGLIDKEEIEFQKEFSEIKIGAEQHWQFELDERNKKAQAEFQAQEQQRKEFEKATEERLRKEAEQKAEAERKLAEETSKKEAEKLAKTPDKDKLIKMINDTNLIVGLSGFKTKEAEECETLIIDKFNAFKSWAKSEIEKL